MKNYVKMFLAGIFLATAFPFTMVLLLNGRQGIHKEKQLDPVDYQVLQQIIAGYEQAESRSIGIVQKGF